MLPSSRAVTTTHFQRVLSSRFALEFCLTCLLVVGGASVRLLFSDLPNFAPIASLALFSGIWLRSRLLAVTVPFGAMLLSDWWLNQPGYEWSLMLAVYGCLALPVLAGPMLRRWSTRIQSTQRRRVALSMSWTIGAYGISLLGAMTFFSVTNLLVWWNWYDHSFEGLSACYLNALPFFRYTLIGDFIFCSTFVLAHGLATYWQMAVQSKEHEELSCLTVKQ